MKNGLVILAELRGAPLPSDDAQNAIASAVDGFDEAAILKGLETLGTAPIGPFDSKMPPLSAIVDACRRSAADLKTENSRWCGRCNMGMVKVQGEWVRCRCNCPDCENSGWVTEMRAIFGFPYKQASFAVKCSNPRHSGGSVPDHDEVPVPWTPEEKAAFDAAKKAKADAQER